MKLGIFATHPIQYQVPLWRELSKVPDWDMDVFYFSEQGVKEGVDPDFGKRISWDIPLLEGYKCVYVQRRPIKKASRFYIPDLEGLLGKNKFDVVLIHGYTHRFARQLIRAKKKYGYKIVLRGEFTEMPRRWMDWKRVLRESYLRWFYGYVDHFCPIGVDATEHLLKFGIRKRQMTLAPYSVNNRLIEKQRKRLDKKASRARLGIADDACVFLFSGKFIPRKQPLLMAEALVSLYPNYPKLYAVFLGSGALHHNLCTMLEEHLGGAFIAPGFINQSELGQYFSASDVLVLPSDYDTWGLVVNEAMHYGLPCIVSDRVGSRRDLVTPGKTGFVFENGNRLSLDEKMRYFLDHPEKIQAMGDHALSRIGGYTIEKTVLGLKTAIASSYV